LLLLVLIGTYGSAIGLVARDLAGAVLITVLLDVSIVRVFWHKYVFPSGALITGLIIAMVLSPQLPWYVPIFASALAILSKHTLKTKRRPWFNPEVCRTSGYFAVLCQRSELVGSAFDTLSLVDDSTARLWIYSD
jgi:Na+-transporting NADH:ubiquinone oxidoreductase subunit NqrB